MNQPSVEPQGSAPTAAPAPTATEIVTRPPPGLARGKWEAPAWAFWVVLALVILGSGAYLLRGLGLLKLRRRGADSTSADPSPPSTRTRRP